MMAAFITTCGRFDHYIANSFNGGEDNVIEVDPYEYLLELDGDWNN